MTELLRMIYGMWLMSHPELPKVVLLDRESYELYESELTAVQMFSSIDWGYASLMFKGIPLVYVDTDERTILPLWS